MERGKTNLPEFFVRCMQDHMSFTVGNWLDTAHATEASYATSRKGLWTEPLNAERLIT